MRSRSASTVGLRFLMSSRNGSTSAHTAPAARQDFPVLPPQPEILSHFLRSSPRRAVWARLHHADPLRVQLSDGCATSVGLGVFRLLAVFSVFGLCHGSSIAFVTKTVDSFWQSYCGVRLLRLLTSSHWPVSQIGILNAEQIFDLRSYLRSNKGAVRCFI